MATAIIEDSAPLRTLIADDQPDVLEALRLLLKGEGYQTEVVDSPARALTALATSQFDLVLVDLNYSRDTTSGAEGLDLLARIHALDGTLPIVAMTAWGNIELAVEAMRRGASDFVLKPWENARLLTMLRTQIERSRVLRQQAQAANAQQEQRRALLAREFAEASEIQQHLLPHCLAQLEGYEIAAAWRPVRTVSGDLFDVLPFTPQQAALCIADASGKGVPAALLMANVQATVKAFAALEVPPQKLCEKINSVVCGNLAVGKFITLFYGVLDGQQKQLTYTNAGHNAPILVRSDGTVLRLTGKDAVLGMFPDWPYTQSTISFASDDRLLLFTDGLTESVNGAGEEFGEERLIEWVTRHRHLSAQEIQQRVLSEVEAFSDGHLQDDATLLVVAVA